MHHINKLRWTSSFFIMLFSEINIYFFKFFKFETKFFEFLMELESRPIPKTKNNYRNSAVSERNCFPWPPPCLCLAGSRSCPIRSGHANRSLSGARISSDLPGPFLFVCCREERARASRALQQVQSKTNSCHCVKYEPVSWVHDQWDVTRPWQ